MGNYYLINNIASSIYSSIRRRLDKYYRTPTTCSLYMSFKCNFKCLGCKRTVVGVEKLKDMDLLTVQELLSLYPSIRGFCIAGIGEPTFCPDFAKIVDYLKKNGKSVMIVSNGTNIEKFGQLSCLPDEISISLYGYNNESYQNYTNIPAFDIVRENFLKLKQRYKNVGCSYVINRTNYKDLEQILAVCDDFKTDFLHLVNYLAYSLEEEEIKKIITVKDKAIIDYVDKVIGQRDYVKIKPVYVDFDNPEYFCKSYNFSIKLDKDGNIGGCLRQIQSSASFGNIYRDKDPYNSQKMREFRKQINKGCYIHEQCKFCFGNWSPK